MVAGKRAVGESAEVVADGGAADGVGVGEECNRLRAVSERGVAGMHDAAGGGIARVAGCARADTAQRVLYHGPVLEHHLALVGFGLVQVAVPLHVNALPHLARAGVGQRATIHNELTAGAHDDSGSFCYKQSVRNS